MGKKIDCRIRTAKYIERRMFVDILKKLETFCSIEKYRYVGFGSIYFTDFILLHKYLNISNMVSIEINNSEKERYLLNKPYKFIDMVFGAGSEVIDKVLNIEEYSDIENHIIWLDYDSFFNVKEVLDSIDKIIMHAKSGAFMAFSFNIDQKLDQEGINKFEENVATYLSTSFKPADFQKATYAKTIRKVINNYIEKRLNILNIDKNNDVKLVYKPLIFMKYRDSVDMLSVGGIFIQQQHLDKYEKSNFKEFEFISEEDNIYTIEVPILTPKEIHIIDNEIIKFDDRLERILESDIEKYKKIYRYYPHYVDSNIL